MARPGSYSELIADCCDVLARYVPKERVWTNEARQHAVSLFATIVRWMSQARYAHLHELDRLTALHCLHEDDERRCGIATDELLRDDAIERDPVYVAFCDAFYSLTSKWANRQWSEMAHGLPTLRYLRHLMANRSTRLVHYTHDLSRLVQVQGGDATSQ